MGVSSLVLLCLALTLMSGCQCDRTQTTVFNATPACDAPFELISAELQCPCARFHDQDRGALLSYMTFHHCTMAGYGGLSLAMLSCWMLFLFYIIAGTTDDYLVPALTVFVDILAISPNVAGATILAFANGAPDLFTNIAAFSGSGGDGDLGMGNLLGGGLFLIGFTLGTVTLVSGGFTSYRRPLIRDVLFYALAYVLLALIYNDHEVSTGESILLLVLYACYVMVVVGGRFIYQRLIKPRKLEKRLKLEESQVEEQQDMTTIREYEERMRRSFTECFLQKTSHSPSENNEEQEQESQDIEQASPDEHTRVTTYVKDTSSSTEGKNRMQHQVQYFFQDLTKWQDKNVFGRFLSLCELPFTLARRCTIALVERETWNRTFTALTMIGALQFVLQCITTPSLMAILITLGFGLVLAILTYRHTNADLPTSDKLRLALVAKAFAVSSFWAYLVANEIVDVMQTIGLGLGISSSVLGVTVLAWGNSIGDLVSNLALAKGGHSKMAAAECFGGPIFNLLFGGGISFLLGSLRDRPKPMTFSRHDIVPGYAFMFLGAVIASIAIAVPLMKFQFRPIFGYVLLGIYFTFIVVAVLAECGKLPFVW